MSFLRVILLSVLATPSGSFSVAQALSTLTSSGRPPYLNQASHLNTSSFLHLTQEGRTYPPHIDIEQFPSERLSGEVVGRNDRHDVKRWGEPSF